jgi:hypothetical protein
MGRDSAAGKPRAGPGHRRFAPQQGKSTSESFAVTLISAWPVRDLEFLVDLSCATCFDHIDVLIKSSGREGVRCYQVLGNPELRSTMSGSVSVFVGSAGLGIAKRTCRYRRPVTALRNRKKSK